MSYDMSWLDDVPVENVLRASEFLNESKKLARKEDEIKRLEKPYEEAKNKEFGIDNYLVEEVLGGKKVITDDPNRKELYAQLAEVRHAVYRQGSDEPMNKFLEEHPDLYNKYPKAKDYAGRLQDIVKDKATCQAAAELVDDNQGVQNKFTNWDKQLKDLNENRRECDRKCLLEIVPSELNDRGMQRPYVAGLLANPNITAEDRKNIAGNTLFNTFHGMMSASQKDDETIISRNVDAIKQVKINGKNLSNYVDEKELDGKTSVEKLVVYDEKLKEICPKQYSEIKKGIFYDIADKMSEYGGSIQTDMGRMYDGSVPSYDLLQRQFTKIRARENTGINDAKNNTGVDKLAERAKAMEGMSSEQRMAYRVEQLRGTKKPESKPVIKQTTLDPKVTARIAPNNQK